MKAIISLLAIALLASCATEKPEYVPPAGVREKILTATSSTLNVSRPDLTLSDWERDNERIFYIATTKKGERYACSVFNRRASHRWASVDITRDAKCDKAGGSSGKQNK